MAWKQLTPMVCLVTVLYVILPFACGSPQSGSLQNCHFDGENSDKSVDLKGAQFWTSVIVCSWVPTWVHIQIISLSSTKWRWFRPTGFRTVAKGRVLSYWLVPLKMDTEVAPLATKNGHTFQSYQCIPSIHGWVSCEHLWTYAPLSWGFTHLDGMIFTYIYIWLVVETPLKNMTSSVGMIIHIPNIMGKIIQMFETTNQIYNHHIPIVVGLYPIFNYY